MPRKLSNKSSLIKEYPELLKEWDYDKNTIEPSDLIIKSDTKAWWKCWQQHSWEATVRYRINQKSGCPYCANQRVLVDFNDLESQYPEIAKLWHPKNNSKKPSEVLAGGNKEFWWLGECGHEWKNSVWKIIKGKGCSYCSGRAILQGFNDLKTLHPELSAEWDYEKNNNRMPEQYRPGSGIKAWWNCKNFNHSWETTIESRVKGAGCIYCSNQRILKGFNDLLTIMPHLVNKYWDYDKNALFPDEVMPSSNKKVWWICDAGHSYDSWIRNIAILKQSCSYCANKKLLRGYNDLKHKNPEIAAEWNYEKNDCNPDEVMYGSPKIVWWKCLDYKHEWQNTIVKRTKRGDSCPYCSNHRVLRGFNDLESQNLELLKEWDYEKNLIQPFEISSGSHTKVHWICQKGHKWKAFPYTRTVIKSNCKKCSKLVSLNERELQSFVKETLGCEVLYNDRSIISPLELDLYIPQLKIAIEYNGDYWHSNQVILKNKGMSAHAYHQMKIDRCKEQGIDLYFVWDNDWMTKKKIVKEALLKLLDNRTEHQILQKLNGIKDYKGEK